MEESRQNMGQKVLIIDDSEDDILLTRMVLAKISRGIDVESALSGEEGLARLRGQSALPSLVLLDLKMPGMDGLDVLRAIKSDERLRSIPVVVVTHSELESDQEACRKAGANGFLHKSVDLERFAEELRKELEKWIK